MSPYQPQSELDSFKLGENQAFQFFDTSPADIVEIEAEEIISNSSTNQSTATSHSTVTFVAKTRTPWLMVIAGGTLVSIACISFFLLGLNTGLKLNQTQPIHYNK
ncbi:hypothetical protein NG798_25550 [Ancylothrix sp. C2]|uniref:hypothetical protein n=1 Tax=Ancylothrix sp. D3o TaxID=2953691 RepID=UPI0021BB61BD|nr:hypothetical protein [Ancylothrix sp. D3o]MCT7953169.1 hypothetical protein [Ancylothrix sp. D3o]